MATRAQPHIRVRESNNLGKRISNHIAYALVMYTLLLIFLVSPQMESKGTSILPYFLLVILVGIAILPAAALNAAGRRLTHTTKAALMGHAIAMPSCCG